MPSRVGALRHRQHPRSGRGVHVHTAPRLVPPRHRRIGGHRGGRGAGGAQFHGVDGERLTRVHRDLLLSGGQLEGLTRARLGEDRAAVPQRARGGRHPQPDQLPGGGHPQPEGAGRIAVAADHDRALRIEGGGGDHPRRPVFGGFEHLHLADPGRGARGEAEVVGVEEVVGPGDGDLHRAGARRIQAHQAVVADLAGLGSVSEVDGDLGGPGRIVVRGVQTQTAHPGRLRQVHGQRGTAALPVGRLGRDPGGVRVAVDRGRRAAAHVGHRRGALRAQTVRPAQQLIQGGAGQRPQRHRRGHGRSAGHRQRPAEHPGGFRIQPEGRGTADPAGLLRPRGRLGDALRAAAELGAQDPVGHLAAHLRQHRLLADAHG